MHVNDADGWIINLFDLLDTSRIACRGIVPLIYFDSQASGNGGPNDSGVKRRRSNFFQTESNDYRESVDRVEVIKLPAHSTNGSVLPAPTSYTTTTNASNSNDSDAPLNLSLKPATTSSSSPISGSQPLSQLSNLSQSLLASDRTCKYLSFVRVFRRNLETEEPSLLCNVCHVAN